MATPSTRYKRVHVRLIVRRKPLKRRSRRAKHRQRTNKFVKPARSLITSDLIKKSTHFTHVSVVRLPTSSTENVVKNRKKKKHDITNQQQISNTKTQDNNTHSSKHNTAPLPGTAEHIHSTKLNGYNDQHQTVLQSSSHILSSNQASCLIPSSLQQSSKRVRSYVLYIFFNLISYFYLEY
jgi:hypothetical protein